MTIYFCTMAYDYLTFVKKHVLFISQILEVEQIFLIKLGFF